MNGMIYIMILSDNFIHVMLYPHAYIVHVNSHCVCAGIKGCIDVRILKFHSYHISCKAT